MAVCALAMAACSSGLLRPAEKPPRQPAPVESHAHEPGPAPVEPAPAVTTPEATPADAATPGDLWQHLPALFTLDAAARPEVRRELDWLEANPKYLTRVATNAGPYLHYVAAELARREMPGELALLPIIESGYNPAVKSPYGAAGLWQFMGGTSNKLGLSLTPWFDGRLDVIQSTDAALQYLAALQKRFDGDWLLAVAAYNAGWGTIERALVKQRRNNRPADLWSLDVSRETRALVARLLALSIVVREPARHGLVLPPLANTAFFDRVELTGPTDLRQFAQQLDIDQDVFKQLNPGWRRAHTGPTLHAEVLIPVAKVAAARELALRLPPSPVPTIVAEAPRKPPGKGQTHTVKSGDSLWTIARRYRLSVDQLAAANGLKASSTLQPGQKIQLGVARDAPASAASGKQKARAARTRYTVQDGDSLWTIARRFKVTVKDLQRWNRLKPKQHLQPGQDIVVAQSP